MPPIYAALLRAVGIILLQIIAFFFFYNHPEGRQAVYRTWYAGIIDVLAILSGSVIMAVSIYTLNHPELFTIGVPSWIFWIAFIVGSWQAAIHLVKIAIRAFSHRT